MKCIALNLALRNLGECNCSRPKAPCLLEELTIGLPGAHAGARLHGWNDQSEDRMGKERLEVGLEKK